MLNVMVINKITRNITFFKKVNNELECDNDDFDLFIIFPIVLCLVS